MKAYLALVAVVVLSAVACTKDHLYPHGNNPVRKVHYELYTDDDFSENQHNIQFSLFMRTNRNTIFDSALATMRVKDIPDFEHRLMFDKIVPGNNPARLAVGFNYHIENVGISWHLEEFPVGDTIKVLKFSFK